MTISQYINKEDWDGLDRQFNKMSNSEFRRSETIVRETLAHVDNDLFWKAYLHLLQYRRQSFLVCILSIERLARTDEISFSCEAAQALSLWVRQESSESVPKILRMTIPILTTERQIEDLLRLFDVTDEREWIYILVKEDTPLAYYMLFKALRTVDDKNLVYQCCVALMKKNNDMAYNMASILKHYFGIDELKAALSLLIEPYELSYIEQNYDNFNHVLNGKRPRL